VAQAIRLSRGAATDPLISDRETKMQPNLDISQRFNVTIRPITSEYLKTLIDGIRWRAHNTPKPHGGDERGQ
jgi:hypothetical protein